MQIRNVREFKNHINKENVKTIFSKHITSGKHESVLVSGRSGTGKTHRFVVPNMLLCNSVYVVADYNEAIKADTEDDLLSQGYTSITLDLANPIESVKYDPMKYVTEDTIDELAEVIICSNFTKETFWYATCRYIMKSLLLYVYRSNGKFNELAKLLDKLIADEKNVSDLLLTTPGWEEYVMVACSKDVRVSCYCSLRALFTENILAITNGDDTLCLNCLGEKKEVYYVNHPITNISDYMLSRVFFYQAANLHPGRTFKEHVTFVLDEFPNNVIEAMFVTQSLGRLRKKNASVFVVIQSIAQASKAQGKWLKYFFNNVVLFCSSSSDSEFWEFENETKNPENLKGTECIVIKDGAAFLDKGLK